MSENESGDTLEKMDDDELQKMEQRVALSPESVADDELLKTDVGKGRRYIGDASDAPEDADVQEGPHGGLYYETEGVSGEPSDEGAEGGGSEQPSGDEGGGGGSDQPAGATGGADTAMEYVGEAIHQEGEDYFSGMSADEIQDDLDTMAEATGTEVEDGWGEYIAETIHQDGPDALADADTDEIREDFELWQEHRGTGPEGEGDGGSDGGGSTGGDTGFAADWAMETVNQLGPDELNSMSEEEIVEDLQTAAEAEGADIDAEAWGDYIGEAAHQDENYFTDLIDGPDDLAEDFELWQENR